MATQLRSIAVHVAEPTRGAFQWVLAELAGDHTWSELLRADAASATYKDAMAEGLVALEAMVDDLDAGPRVRAASGHGHSPAQKRTAREEPRAPAADGEAAVKARRSVFGFGLAN